VGIAVSILVAYSNHGKLGGNSPEEIRGRRSVAAMMTNLEDGAAQSASPFQDLPLIRPFGIPGEKERIKNRPGL